MKTVAFLAKWLGYFRGITVQRAERLFLTKLKWNGSNLFIR